MHVCCYCSCTREQKGLIKPMRSVISAIKNVLQLLVSMFTEDSSSMFPYLVLLVPFKGLSLLAELGLPLWPLYTVTIANITMKPMNKTAVPAQQMRVHFFSTAISKSRSLGEHTDVWACGCNQQQ